MKNKLVVILTGLLILCSAFMVACGGAKTTLNAPSIELSENVVSWTAVENAEKYEITVNGAVKTTVNTLSYTVTETAVGSYVITVKAIPNDTSKFNVSKASNSVTYTVVSRAEKLEKPVVTILGNVISWQAIDGAINYDIYLDGTFFDNVEGTSYEFDTMPIKVYSVTVVAKSADTREIKHSDPSDVINYNVGKAFVKIEKIADPAITTYYLDENKSLDLTGLSVKAYYGNADAEDITLTADDIVSDYDMNVEGRYELEFEYVGANMVASSIWVRINVIERTLADVSSYDTVINEYSVSNENYKIADGTVENVVDMKGNEITVISEGGNSYADIPEGETLLKIDGEFVNVIVARYVKTVEDFNDINQALDGYYMLMNNLDFSELNCSAIGVAPIKLNGETPELDTTGATGIAFNGTFNGNGYAIRNYTLNKAGLAWNDIAGRGVAMFGYVGETGKICNIVLRDVTVKGMNNTSFVVGYNKGIVENVLVESDCVLFNNYEDQAIISAFNYGTVRNVVSYALTSENVNIVTKGDTSLSQTGINGYIDNTDDLTSVLGDGWTYIEDYGTVYGNSSYKKVLSADSTIKNGGNLEVAIYQANWSDPEIAVWGAGYSADAVLEYKSNEKLTDNLYVFTFGVKSGVTLTKDAELTVGVTADGYFDTFKVTVIEDEIITPEPEEPDTTVYEKLAVSVSNNKIEYSKTTALDIKSLCSFTFTAEDGGTPVSVDASEITVSEVFAGNKEVTFTYTSGGVVYGVKHTFEIWYVITEGAEWSLMNTHLDGYFKLGNEIDLDGATYSAVIGSVSLDDAGEGYQIATDGVGEAQTGVAFTGKFDGCGYAVKNFASDYTEAPYAISSYGLVPFAYVGAGAYVGNFTMQGASIRCGQSGSFISALNLGTIEKITVASDCTLYVNYSSNSPVAAVYNAGTVDKITCNVTTFTSAMGTGTYDIEKIVFDGTDATDSTIVTE